MSLSRTLSRLKRGREAFATAYPESGRATAGSGRLSNLDLAFPNPGNLNARCFVPDTGAPPAGLLVVLHGCTQNAGVYDQGSGWSLLAERHGFALLYPEQKRENNPNLCFNWYQRGDAARGRGEAASIAAMVEAMAAAHGIGRDRTFITGLSAGGAMAATMLATYPELFAGGAILAGIPHGCAANLSEAFDCMAGRLPTDQAALVAGVRAASPHRGPWPRLSVWQGSGDRIVAPANAQALVAQWTGLLGLKSSPDRVETVDGHQRRVWLDASGREAIEHFDIAGMAHGIPLMPGTDEGQSGKAGAHMLDVGLSSTDRIAAFFSLAPAAKPARAPKPMSRTPDAPRHSPRRPERLTPRHSATPHSGGIQQTIEDALRSAGLMR